MLIFRRQRSDKRIIPLVKVHLPRQIQRSFGSNFQRAWFGLIFNYSINAFKFSVDYFRLAADFIQGLDGIFIIVLAVISFAQFGRNFCSPCRISDRHKLLFSLQDCLPEFYALHQGCIQPSVFPIHPKPRTLLELK